MSSNNLSDFFSNISDRSITAKENFSCCTPCGFTAIEIFRKPIDVGFVFYHKKDTEAAIKTGILHLSWGAYSDDEIDIINVANAIVDEAQACKLEAKWDGAITDRIVIKNVDKTYFEKFLISGEE